MLTHKQGDGRFDDPERLIGIVYAAADLRTCLLELLRSWPPADAAGSVLTDIEPPEDEDEAEQAEFDRTLASALLKSPSVPEKIYERNAVFARTETPLQLVDLLDSTTQLQLEADPDVAQELRCHNFLQFDVGVLTAREEFRPVTQSVTNAVLRSTLYTESARGLFSLSRHDGKSIYAIFQDGKYDDALSEWNIAEGGPLTPDHPTLVEVAGALGLTP